MIRTRLKVLNAQEVAAAFGEQIPRVVRQGLRSGVMKAAEIAAEDLRIHAPVRRGRARNTIMAEPIGELSARAGFDPQKAFYIRFIEDGADPHTIRAKRRLTGAAARLYRHGLTLRKEAEKEFGLDRKSEGAFKYAEENIERRFYPRGLGAGFSIKKPKLKGALAFSPGGGLRIVRHVVDHPGIRPRKFIHNRLLVTKDRLAEAIAAGIAAAANLE